MIIMKIAIVVNIITKVINLIIIINLLQLLLSFTFEKSHAEIGKTNARHMDPDPVPLPPFPSSHCKLL